MTRQRFTENPFYVLGLRPDCSRADLEREGQKLLAMLELQMESAKTYPTPLGPMPRTADAVRQAMAELRDPQRRLLHEVWAQLPATPPAGPATSSATGSATGLAPGSAAAADPAAAAGSAGPSRAAAGDHAAADQSAAPRRATGAPPSWPQARAALGFGARR